MAKVASDSRPDPLEPLRSPIDFRRVLDEGRRIRKAGLTIVIAHSDLPTARLGMVVPRRVGGAVVRNRIKRRIRHAARQAGWGSGDYVVLPQRAVANMPFDELVESLRVDGRP